MASDAERTEGVAFHEAGHAIASLRLGIGVEIATIIPTHKSLGNVVLSGKPPTMSSRDYLIAMATISLAGPAAQYRFCRRTWHRVCGVVDHHEAETAAVLLGDSRAAARAWIGLWEVQARDLITRNKIVVEVIANTLVAQQTLSGDQLSNVVEQIDAVMAVAAAAARDRQAHKDKPDADLLCPRGHWDRWRYRGRGGGMEPQRREIAGALLCTLERNGAIHDQLLNGVLNELVERRGFNRACCERALDRFRNSKAERT